MCLQVIFDIITLHRNGCHSHADMAAHISRLITLEKLLQVYLNEYEYLVRYKPLTCGDRIDSVRYSKYNGF